MASVNIYLNFPNHTEEAFNFYAQVFQSKIAEPGFRRFSDIPPMEGMPPMPEDTKNLVMHVALPLFGGFVLMGSDAPASMGFTVNAGNNTYISVYVDSRADAERIFQALAEGGKIEQPLSDMFWGAYFGTVTDRFKIQWMIQYAPSQG